MFVIAGLDPAIQYTSVGIAMISDTLYFRSQSGNDGGPGT